MIFVCGGDGKSELLRRIYNSYGTKVRFHLDATHSFDPKPDNPFFVAYKLANPESQHARNFYLLQIPEVREMLMDVLLHAHLRYDQFLTARTVLDFVYRILTGEGFLFDNIFRLSGSDLLDALQKNWIHARNDRNVSTCLEFAPSWGSLMLNFWRSGTRRLAILAQ